MLPFVHESESEGNISEERRLCYVAMTRAQRELTLSLCRYRRRQGELLAASPSRFLAEIQDSVILRNYSNFSQGEEKPAGEQEADVADLSFKKMRSLFSKQGK